MGSSYCLSTDKKTMHNEQILNVNIYEENLEEKKVPQSTNMEIINKNINTNENHSNNTGINHLNNITNHSNIIINNINISKKSKNHKNNSENNHKLKFHQNSNKINNNNTDNNESEKNNIKKKVLALNNDVIVSGNEVNPEKIYIKSKMLGSGAFGEVWLVRHKDLNRDFAMKIIKKRKNKSNEEKEKNHTSF